MKIRITGIRQIQLAISSILAAGIFQQTESSAKSSDLRRTKESCHKVKPARLIRKIHITGTDLNHKTALMIFFASVFMQFPGLAVQSVDLAWNPSTNATVMGYNIYSGTTREGVQYSKAIQLGKCVVVVVHARGAENRIKAPGILSSGFNDLQPNRAYAKNLISNRGNNLPGSEGGAS